MTYIKKLYINGFKKFSNLEIEFKNQKNIIIGENERGKSTILEAIDIIVNQKYKNIDKYIVRELLNKEQKCKCKEDFLIKIQKEGISVKKYVDDNKYRIFGLPFFNKDLRI